MTATLETRAEIVKLARLLTVDEAEVGFLSGLPASALRELSRGGDRPAVRRRCRDVPSGRRGDDAGPVGDRRGDRRARGRATDLRAGGGCIDTGKALDVLRRLSPEFVADATVEVDPRRVVDLIAEVPAELALPVAPAARRPR